MTIIRQMGPMELLQSIEEGITEEKDDRQAKGRRQQIKAQAYAQVCSMYRVGANEMTAQHRAYAEAIEKRMLGETTTGKGFGFSLPGVADRRPNIR